MAQKRHFEINRPLVTDLYYVLLFEDFLPQEQLKVIEINIDLMKSFPNLLTFYLINSMNCNAKFPALIICTLFTTRFYEISKFFLHSWKCHAQNGSDSTPRILTLASNEQFYFIAISLTHLLFHNNSMK